MSANKQEVMQDEDDVVELEWQCVVPCYCALRKGDKLRKYDLWEVFNLPEDVEIPEDLSKKFICLSAIANKPAPESFDYATATKAQMMAMDLSFGELSEFCSENYDVELQKDEKEVVIDSFMYARDNHNPSQQGHNNPYTSPQG